MGSDQVQLSRGEGFLCDLHLHLAQVGGGSVGQYDVHHHGRTEVDSLYSAAHDKSGWMTSWNVRHSFSSPWRVQEIMRTASFLPGAVRELEMQTRRVLARYLGWLCKIRLPIVSKLYFYCRQLVCV